jgi:hypothetical protein
VGIWFARPTEGETAIFGGDVLHHPFEIYEPDLFSAFCEFPDHARARHWLLEYAAESGATYFSSHFGGSSAGYIVRKSGGYK